MRLIIAGERSGVGKTTVTLAILAALRQQGETVQSFKVGPDYIDPMFHRHVTGRPCHNLDPVLTSEAYVQQCFAARTQTVTHAVVEGVMGLFDGAADRPGFASTAHIARLLNLPILLVLDCSRLSQSIAALVHGYRSFDPRLRLAGVVLNRVGSDRHEAILQAALEPLKIPILGILRRQDSITIPDRHLGLVPTNELDGLKALIDQLAYLGASCFDWEALRVRCELLSAGCEAEGVESQESGGRSRGGEPLPLMGKLPLVRDVDCLAVQRPVRLAIAQDAAFSFYYADNLALLESLGAELVPWSPLQDEVLPSDIQGLYFGGGFPEMFAETLAANKSARVAVQVAMAAGIPTYAECGGLMYLCQQITDFEGRSFPMVGSLPTTAVMGKRLTLGYRQVKTLQNGLLFEEGAIAWGHEFHRSHLTAEPIAPLFAIQPVSQQHCPQPKATTFEGWHQANLHASYIHLHWGATPEIPQRFLHRCAEIAIRPTRNASNDVDLLRSAFGQQHGQH